MNIVQIEDGQVVVPPEPVALPEVITKEFLDAVFASPIASPGHIAELHLYLTLADKRKFMIACDLFGAEYFDKYAHAAMHWASVGEDDGVWKLNDIIYSADIHSWLIKSVHVTTHGFWYVVSPKENIIRDANGVEIGRTPIIMSAMEFQIEYGDTIPEHLRRQLEYYPERVNQVLVAIESQWVAYELTLCRGDTIFTEKRLGPPNIDPKEWKLKPGDQFLDAKRVQ